MKKIFLLLSVPLFLFASCANDDRIDADTIGQTAEIVDVDFVAPDFAINVPLRRNNLEAFESDIILVYRLEDVVNQRNIWEPLPTSLAFLDNGAEFLYRFNFSQDDVDILLETPDASLISDNFLLDQVFRIVVVPASFAVELKSKSYQEVISTLKLNNIPFKTLNVK